MRDELEWRRQGSITWAGQTKLLYQLMCETEGELLPICHFLDRLVSLASIFKAALLNDRQCRM